MERLDLYKCNICGNMVQVIFSGNGELVCCGQPMENLIPQKEEEAIMEAHIPIFIKTENNCEVRVGEILHPMTNTHYIQFIQVISDDKKIMHHKYLNPDEDPRLHLNAVDLYKTAREFCNIHGLWEGKND